MPPSVRFEEPVNRGGADRLQGVADASWQPEFAMPLEGGEEFGEKRPQALGAQVATGDPELLQRRLDVFAVQTRAAPPRAMGRGAAVEKPYDGFPIIARDTLGRIEKSRLLRFLGQPIPRTEGVEVFADRTWGHGASCRW